LKPKAENMLVEGDNLRIERGRQKYHLQLADYPELAAFIDSIRGTLAGDRKALERSYQLNLEGTAANWTLQLVPNTARMQQVVSRIRITGVRKSRNAWRSSYVLTPLLSVSAMANPSVQKPIAPIYSITVIYSAPLSAQNALASRGYMPH
ncbi:MAG: LolA-related protein, partial [Sulfuriferula sp.]